MTSPSVVPEQPIGRGAGEGAEPAASLWRGVLRWSIVAAFVLRAVLSLFDTQTAVAGGLRSLPLVSSVSLGSGSPIWPLTWGTLALVTAFALALRIRIGWLLGTAVTVAYLVAGIADASAVADTFGQDPGRALWIVWVGLVVPVAILAGLLAIREWYLPASRPLAPGHKRQQHATPPTLDRLRRRN